MTVATLATQVSESQISRSQLLYLPGMDGTGNLFYRQEAYLQADFWVNSVSLNSRLLNSPENWPDLVAHVYDQIQQIQPDQTVVLCGESFGACLALRVAVQYPKLCAGLILINPASSFRRGPWWLSTRMLLPFIPATLYNFSTTQGLGILAELHRIDQVDQQHFRWAVQSVPQVTTIQRLALLSSFDVEELPLEDLEIPTLLIAGAKDRLLPSVQEVHRLADRLPQARVEIASYSGHACLLERDFNLRDILVKKQMFLPTQLNNQLNNQQSSESSGSKRTSTVVPATVI